MASHVPEAVHLAFWFEKNGISRELQKYYLKSGWLELFGPGVFKRPNMVWSIEFTAETNGFAGACLWIDFFITSRTYTLCPPGERISISVFTSLC